MYLIVGLCDTLMEETSILREFNISLFLVNKFIMTITQVTYNASNATYNIRKIHKEPIWFVKSMIAGTSTKCSGVHQGKVKLHNSMQKLF